MFIVMEHFAGSVNFVTSLICLVHEHLHETIWITVHVDYLFVLLNLD